MVAYLRGLLDLAIPLCFGFALGPGRLSKAFSPLSPAWFPVCGRAFEACASSLRSVTETGIKEVGCSDDEAAYQLQVVTIKDLWPRANHIQYVGL